MKETRVFFMIAILFSVVGFPHLRPAAAADVDYFSKTYIQSFEDSQNGRHTPLFEYAELNIRNLSDRRISFYSGGWIRYDLKAPGLGERKVDELSYAYLRYAPTGSRSLLFDIGRFRTVDGLATGVIDGISSRWEITPETGISAFGGVPVATEFDGRRGDFTYGGRLFQRIDRKAEMGLSYLREGNDGSRYREEVGFDLWVLPVRQVEITGRSSYNMVTDGWAEHAYNARVVPLEGVTTAVFFARTDYHNTFSSTTLSVFTPEFFGKDERLTKAGASVEYRIAREATLMLSYTGYDYRTLGTAGYYGAHFAWKTFETAYGGSLCRMEGDTERLRYIEGRVYGRRDFDPFRVALDAIVVSYDKDYNGLKRAYSTVGTVEYKLTSTLTAGLMVDYRKSPDFSHATSALAKLTYATKKEVTRQ